MEFMRQWEYEKINLSELPRKTEDIDLLNNAGQDGWELVGIVANNFAYLKRLREESAPAQEAPPLARSTRRKAATGAK